MKKKIMAFLVATTSLPAVYHWNDDRWNAAHSCQKFLGLGFINLSVDQFVATSPGALLITINWEGNIVRHMKMVQGALDISSVYSYLGALTAKTTTVEVEVLLLSKPKLIHNSTQPQSNITLVG